MMFDQVASVSESDLDDSYCEDISNKGNYETSIYENGEVEERRSSLRNVALNEIRKIVPPGGRVLEVGSSTGDFVALLNENGYRGFGIDISKFACGIARSKMDNIFIGDYVQRKFRSGFFDCIFFSAVLVHIRSPYEALLKARRELKKGGKVLILERDWGWFRTFEKLRRLFGIPTSFRYCLNFFSPATAASLLKHAGYKLHRLRNIGNTLYG